MRITRWKTLGFAIIWLVLFVKILVLDKRSKIRFWSTSTEPKLKAPDGLHFLNDLHKETTFINILDNLATAEEKYQTFIMHIDVECNHSVRIGHANDGGWNMCLVGPYHPGRHCLVYSFGIGDDWSFDEAISSQYNCNVKAFDPSLKNAQKSTNHSDLVWFYPYGLSGVNRLNTRNWQLRTFRTLLEKHGDLKKVIDYLKIDIEKSEWESLETMQEDGTLNNVKQLGIEVHVGFDHREASTMKPMEYRYYQSLLQKLHQIGFRKWYIHRNKFCWTKLKFNSEMKEIYLCHELVYINKNFM